MTSSNSRHHDQPADDDRAAGNAVELVSHGDEPGPIRWVNEQRYTGSELSALLDQVRKELGAEANIVKADRVRTGGVAGFFTRERFEVVAAGQATRPTVDSGQPNNASQAPTQAPTQAIVAKPKQATEIAAGLLARAEAISVQEREGLRSRRRQPDGRGRGTTELVPDLRRPDPRRPELGRPDDEIHDLRDPVEPSPSFDQILDVELRRDEPIVVTSPTPTPTGRRSLLDRDLVTVVGSLPAAQLVAEKLLVAEDRELVVVTEQAFSGRNALAVGRRYEDISRHLHQWRVSGRRGVVILDLALGSSLGVELRCLQSLGSDLVRLAVDDSTDLDVLLGLLDRVDCPVVADDLTSGTTGTEFLLDRGVPVADDTGLSERSVRYPAPRAPSRSGG